MKAIEITTTLPCHTNCKYCPQDVLSLNYKSDIKSLSIENFNLVLDKIPGNTRIHFSGFSEPSQSSYFLNFLERVYLWDVVIYSNLNFFNQSIIDFINYDMTFLKLNIHIINNMKWFLQATDFANLIDDNNLKKNIAFIKVGDSNLRDYIVNFLLRQPYPVLYQPMCSRANNLRENVFDFKTPLKCMDSRTEQNVLLPNGDLHICCMDYGLKYKLGNLFTDSLEDINKQKFNFYEDMRVSDDPDFICKKCFRAVEI